MKIRYRTLVNGVTAHPIYVCRKDDVRVIQKGEVVIVDSKQMKVREIWVGEDETEVLLGGLH